MTAVAPARPAPPAARRATDRWAGTGALVRVALRVERVRLGVWLVAVAGLTAVSAASEADLFPTPESRAARAELMRSPAAVALGGPGYGLDDYTIGAMVANELGAWVALALAVLSVLLVVRHLRGAEESGLLEVVRSTPVGRDAPVLAAVVVVTLADLAIGLALAAALAGTGLPVAGALAFGLGCGLVGLTFGATAAVAAQLVRHARTASMLGLAATGAGFVLRAAGDVRAPESGSALSWLSPFGWSQATRAWVDERWWPLALPVLASAAAFGLAALLAERRDLGDGLLPERAGRAHASPRLAGVAAVTLRRLGGALTGWAVGVAAICGLVGVLAREVVQFIEDEPALAAFFPEGAGGAGEAALSRYLLVAVALAAAAGVQGVAAARPPPPPGRPGARRTCSRGRWAGCGGSAPSSRSSSAPRRAWCCSAGWSWASPRRAPSRTPRWSAGSSARRSRRCRRCGPSPASRSWCSGSRRARSASPGRTSATSP
uniref:anibiotic ABC transporter n=1 Tax=Cellulomonas hominis TaxID=156981 RepID=UPI001E39CD40|nr:anibiotic ABC transporter [Cellulomonas hominis]